MFSCEKGKVFLASIFLICLLYVEHYNCYHSHIRTNYLLRSYNYIKQQQQNINNKNNNKIIFNENNKINLFSIYATTNIISPFDSR